MVDTHSHDESAAAEGRTDGGASATEVRTDGGSSATEVRTDGGKSDVEREREIDYLEVEINLLKPATPFMRDHLRVIWIGFGIWVITTFGPITATRIAPDLMTTPMPIIEFPFHYFSIAIVGPSAALLLSVWYAKKRDEIDEKYGIQQVVNEPVPGTDAGADAAAADGGVEE